MFTHHFSENRALLHCKSKTSTDNMAARPAASRSRDGSFSTSKSPMRVPRTIRAISSGASLLSGITLDEDLFAASPGQRDTFKSSGNTKYIRSPSPVPSPQSTLRQTTTTTSTKDGQRKMSDGPSALRKFRCAANEGLSQSEHHANPIPRMELDSSPNRDLPPNPTILQRRCTEPLSQATREACLQDLGCLEDGRKTVLVKRFGPLPKFERAASDDSYSSMPLKMPVRKASVEEIRRGSCPRSIELKQPMRQSSIPSLIDLLYLTKR